MECKSTFFNNRLSWLLLLVVVFPLACNRIKGQDGDHKFTNALINETSPYLLQHAHNPVDWRPWGQEALDEAKKSDKLVLVSIGYSSCHWCHVMEEETFVDEEVAKIMNANFINIKVDREERPDVDQVYMTALQLIKGSGGWPLNVITLPNGKPIYGGTYHTNAQWKKVLTEVSKLYREDPEKANKYADMVAQGIQETNIVKAEGQPSVLSRDLLSESVRTWRANWDLEWGGQKEDQKFMLPGNMEFLLDYSLITGDRQAKDHVKTTLDRMAMGGVYDQIGGGFYRYSTDRYWKVPHFEKMLYDNAQLIGLYSKAYLVFKDPLYKEVVLETIAFLEREMKDPEGGYYAALDADTEGEEGKFYVWGEPELQKLLRDDFERFSDYYNIKPSEVWEKDTYVLYRKVGDKDFTGTGQISESDLSRLKTTWKTQLLAAREKRIRPRTDDKKLTSWNALLITGFVDAYKAFGNKDHLKRAEEIYGFLQDKAVREGQLVHSYKKDGKLIPGFLEDYSYLAEACLQLYGATMDVKYLERAQELNSLVQAKFADPTSGMYRYNGEQELISKIIKTDDGVLPSPNGVMAHNLFKLGHIKYDRAALAKANEMLTTMATSIKDSPSSYSQWGLLLLQTVHPYYEIAVVGPQAAQMLRDLEGNYVPNTLVVGSPVASSMPLFKDRFDESGTFIYVCQDTTCKLPVDTVEGALEQLRNF
tara:strand:- start:67521 stop:69635 length:2115 start_codon:yes stop_codon:yes gene_type:complete